MNVDIKLDNVTSDGNASYEVLHIHVNEGDHITHDDVVMVVEGDKAVIDITPKVEGIIREVIVTPGQVVAEGDIYLRIEPLSVDVVDDAYRLVSEGGATPETNSGEEKNYDVVVIGSGPGGYTAAFRAADLGLRVALIERYPSLGGVCLNVGCIPSKSLLHISTVINEANDVRKFGVEFEAPKIDLEKIRSWKGSVLTGLTDGIRSLADLRKIDVLHGNATFLNSNKLLVENEKNEPSVVAFDNAIIAAGSRANKVNHLPVDPRIIDSADALEIADIPKRLLVIGGGIIGLEMATVYESLGSQVTVAAKYDQLIPECDADIIKPLYERCCERFEILLETIVTKLEAEPDRLVAHFEGHDDVPKKQYFDKALVAIGRHPNGHNLNADLAGVYVNESGFIPVDKYQRTNVSNVFAIGDIAGKPMLAHKAIAEGKVAAEVIAGLHSRFDATVVPSVAYTDPEVAWLGLTEKEAKRKGVRYGVGTFPWAASGRALSLGRAEGKTKILFDLVTDEIIGAGIVGVSAGDLISELALAIENKIKAKDLSLTIHPHPTLSETVAFATEVYESTITDLFIGGSIANKARD